ncbi:MAG: hypothetical protein KDA81_15860, partial [Planctomycetaceae bacterium]|nr:hypothetical protein [Planctomycetaceae bacterium]
RCDELVLNIDIAPTVLDIAGLPVPERMQGRSLVPLLNLKAEDLPTRHVQPDSRVSQNSQPWREVFVYEGLGKYADIKPHLAAVSRTSRLIQTFESLDAADVIFEELYDRTQDADELRNQIQEPAREAQINTLRSAIRQHLLNRKSGN